VRLERLLEVIKTTWGEKDTDAEYRGVLRPNGLVDLTVISILFEGLNGLERESLFWRVFDTVPRDHLVYMTYCLLLTPQEAKRHFASPPTTPL
jgi:hypothetical protein